MKFPWHILGLALGGGLLLLDAPAAAQTKKFTLNADFDTGTLNNVVHNPADQIVLGPTPVSKTHLVWATNYLYGYVVRIDSQTGKQTSRFDSVLENINGQPTGARPAQEYCDFATVGNCPGRVAVDTNGDVWIINRAFGHQGTLSKFSGNLAHCIDRNNNGVIDTSFDKNNDGIIDVNPAAGEYFGQNDECILTTIPIGPFNVYPRGVAVDKNGKIWVSTYVDGKVYRYNPNEPVALEATVNVGGNPYSLATGGDYLFISKASGTTMRVNITTLATQSVPCPGTYGIVGDPGGNVAWLGGWTSSTNGLLKADFTNNTCNAYPTPGSNITAVTLDLQGNIWACGYSNATVYKFNPAGVLLGSYPAGGANPHGMSVDFQGNLWTILHGPPSVSKINVNTGALLGAYGIGGPGIPNADPYLYSDFTGTQIDRQAPYTYVGSWDGTYDGQVPGLKWSKVTWNTEAQGAVPAGTTLVVSAHAADTLVALGSAPYTPVANGGAIAGITGRYIQVRSDLKGPGWKTSVLSDVTVTGPCPVPGPACCVTNGDCSDANVCTNDACPVPGGACVYTAVPGCCNTAADCNDNNSCTSDTCPVPGGNCQYAAVAGCCNSNADCNDGDLCSADICSGPGGACTHPKINGCCNTDQDCKQGNSCSNATCPVPGGFCVGGSIPGCCKSDADCADVDLCTLDKCDLATNTCSNTKQVGCCNVDGDCNDNDTCTSDHCSGPGGTCVFSQIPNCCSPNDPKIGQDCQVPVSPFDKLPCKPGKLVCTNGAFTCVGAVGPGIEICDGIDNNCDGIVDSPPPCPMAGESCVNGVCVAPCGGGENPCPGNQQCSMGYCVPTTCDMVVCPSGKACVNGLCLDSDGGPSTTSTGTGAGGNGTSSSATGAGGAMGSGGAGTTSGNGGAVATTTSTGESTGTSSSSGFFGLATGGGGCHCELAGGTSGTGSRGGLALTALALALGLSRRRTGKREA